MNEFRGKIILEAGAHQLLLLLVGSWTKGRKKTNDIDLNKLSAWKWNKISRETEEEEEWKRGRSGVPLTTTLINNHWRVDASTWRAGVRGERRHLVLINESGNRFWSGIRLNGRLNCRVILVNRGIPDYPITTGRGGKMSDRAGYTARNRGFFLTPPTPLRAANEHT